MELLVVVGVLAVLSAMLIPALANTQPDSRLFQCQNNERQIVLAWRMYADDNNDVLAPNDYPGRTTQPWVDDGRFVAWVAGTMNLIFDATAPIGANILVDPRGSRLATYVRNAAVYKCPADTKPGGGVLNTSKPLVRSYSMNSAVGTLWANSSTFLGSTPPFGAPPLGSPVQGAWLPAVPNAHQTEFLTYGRMASFTRPGPAGTWVIMEENSLTISDCIMAIPAVRGTNGYMVDYPAGYHDAGGVISFADGHALVHKWQDPRTYTPPPFGAGSSQPVSNDSDTDYLASITSAAR